MNEDGDTLIEILISIMILSFGVIGIYSALTGSIMAADRVRGRATAAQVVTQVANEVQLVAWECAETPLESYRSALERLKPTPGWTIVVTSISHWGPSRSFEDGCPSPDSDAVFRLQRVAVMVSAPGSRVQQTVELLKRP